MRKTIAALAVLISTSAMATDLPSRAAPAAPAPLPIMAATPSFYVGGNFGGIVTDGINKDTPWSIGGVAGYRAFDFGPLGISAEGTVDYNKNKDKDVIGNGVVSYSTGIFGLTPYVLGGVGYRWSDVKNEAIWNAGAGVRVSITDSIDVDTRYRRTNNFDNNRAEDKVTLGVIYKF